MGRIASSYVVYAEGIDLTTFYLPWSSVVVVHSDAIGFLFQLSGERFAGYDLYECMRKHASQVGRRV